MASKKQLAETPASQAPSQEEPVKLAPKERKLPKHHIAQLEKIIVCSGKDVKVSSKVKDANIDGLVNVEGALDVPCEQPVKLTFKSTAKASAFFVEQLNEEDEAKEYLIAGSRTEWHGDELGSFGDEG